MRDISGQVAMISGANRGIGAALATALHANGWALALGARDVASLQETLQSTAANSGAPTNQALITTHQYDAKDLGAPDHWVAEVIEAHGRLDCLVNNAGVIHTDLFDELTEEHLEEMWAVNAKAPLFMTRAALPHLRQSGEGRIVNVISMSGKRVNGTFAPGYAMSKHAAMALHHSVRHGEFKNGIRCTAVCPGYVKTDMTADFGVDESIMIDANDLADTVAHILRLENTASVAELLVSNVPETIA